MLLQKIKNLLKNEHREKSVCLVGPLPEPIGGVSTYCNRCVCGDLAHLYGEVVDVYQHKNKLENVSQVKHHVAPHNAIFGKLMWFWRKISFTNSQVVHFNFSSVNSLFFLLICIKMDRRWVLMLHNGRLKKGNFFQQILIKLALEKFDKILALSPKQIEYYAQFDFTDKLELMDSYLPPVIEKKSGDYLFSHVFTKFDKVVLGSGYSLDIYRFDFIVKFAENNPEIGVIIVVYGNSTKDIVELLTWAKQQFSNFFVFNAMPESEFLYLLSIASVYVRPNDVDSFGIACADAILLNTPVVASDVCTRFVGCALFETGNYSHFEQSVNNALYITPNVPHDLIRHEIEFKIKQYKKVYLV